MQLAMFGPDPCIQKSAEISECGCYRYELRRRWSQGDQLVAFIGLNPSTADANNDDPTLRRCIDFARRWGCDGLVMVNLFAYRATEPKVMKVADDPIGPENNAVLCRVANECSLVVACWGHHGSHMGRDRDVMVLLDSLLCMGLTKDGHPRHPLYMPKDSQLCEFWNGSTLDESPVE